MSEQGCNRGTPCTCRRLDGAGHKDKIRRIVFGYPTAETFAAAERREVSIGGCLPDLPVERACTRCGLTASTGPTNWSGPVSGDGQAPDRDRPDSPIRA